MKLILIAAMWPLSTLMTCNKSVTEYKKIIYTATFGINEWMHFKLPPGVAMVTTSTQSAANNTTVLLTIRSSLLQYLVFIITNYLSSGRHGKKMEQVWVTMECT